MEPVFYTVINDIWYHVSKFIPPEYVQTFALICRSTAEIVRTKSFWKHIYLKYCQKFDDKAWIKKLPASLQWDNIRNYSPPVFRASVIKSLFICYAPLLDRSYGYNFNKLYGKTFICAWQEYWDGYMWVACYQFKQSDLPMPNKKTEEIKTAKHLCDDESDVVNDWDTNEIIETIEESENTEESENSEESDISEESINSEENIYDGVWLLLLFNPRFIPLPRELTYDENMYCNQTRITDSRQYVEDIWGKSFREYNLEMDLINTIKQHTITIKYSFVTHYIVPWWKPFFKRFMKLKTSDKFL